MLNIIDVQNNLKYQNKIFKKGSAICFLGNTNPEGNEGISSDASGAISAAVIGGLAAEAAATSKENISGPDNNKKYFYNGDNSLCKTEEYDEDTGKKIKETRYSKGKVKEILEYEPVKGKLVRSTSFFSEDNLKKIVNEFSQETGVNIKTTWYRKDDTIRDIEYYHYITGKPTHFCRYFEDGKTQELEKIYYEDGSLLINEYDAKTKTKVKQTIYRADGTLQTIFEFSPQTQKCIKQNTYRENGTLAIVYINDAQNGDWISIIEYGEDGKTVNNAFSRVVYTEDNDKEILHSLSLIKDRKLRKMIEKLYNSDKKNNINKAAKLIDIYNNYNECYETLRYDLRYPNGGLSPARNYIKYCKDNNIDIMRGYETEERYSDLKEEQKFGQLIDYCEYNDDEISEYLYDKYLESIDIRQIRRKLASINKAYGTKIFLPTSQKEFWATSLDYIEEEWQIWKKASDNKAKYPRVLNLLRADTGYLTRSKVGQAGSNGIDIDGCLNLEYALRHEMMHLNDESRRNQKFPSSWYEAGGKTIKKEIRKRYDTEFMVAGINRAHVSYAYKNACEFIAVAAEGDISKYSNDFIKLLVCFGMPKWAVNLTQNRLKI